MTDVPEPRRLLDDPSTADALREALEAGRDDLPTEHELASLAARLGPLLGPGGGGGGTPLDPSIGLSGGLAAKAVGILAAAAVAGSVVLWVAREEAPVQPPRERAPVVRDEPAPEPEVPEGIDIPDELLPEELAPEELAAAPDPPRAPRVVPPVLEVDPEAELELVRAAQDALRTSPERALALTDEHRRRFGEGTLVQEREVVAIDALARLGRDAAARARAQSFHTRFPRSAHRRRVDVIVPSEP